jgi:hypothetical protein
MFEQAMPPDSRLLYLHISSDWICGDTPAISEEPPIKAPVRARTGQLTRR